jgi:lipopolysaccharide heptosyltransferase II
MRSVFETTIKSAIKKIYLATREIALRTLSPLFFQKKFTHVPDNIGNILFIRVDRVGDMVLSTPAYKAIKTAFPQVRLTVMASMVNAPILKNNPYVDEIIVYDRFASLTEKVRLLKGLRARHFDLAIDPFDDHELETAWMAWMSGSTNRIGYAAFGREVFLNASIQKRDEKKHFVDVTLDLMKAIGVSSDNKLPVIYLDEDEQSWATQWINEKGLQSKMLIAVHPGAYYETQRWPQDYYADLIRLIRECTEAKVIIFGGPRDASLIEDILANVKNPVCISIQEDIRKFFAVLSFCRLLVCNNSGPLHCAIALNIPTISFMGPTIKERWVPIGGVHHVFRRDELPCIGCNLGTCKIKTHDCMRLIKPQIVMERMLAMMVSVSSSSDMTAINLT